MVGDTVYFDASTSFVKGATITAYAFTIDGKFSGWKSEPYYEYTFYSAGEHTVKLSVMINDRFINESDPWNIIVSSAQQNSSITVTGEAVAGKPLTITVYCPKLINWITIDYGDGETETSPTSLFTTYYTFTHTYQDAGVYTITAQIHSLYEDITVDTTVVIESPSIAWWWVAIGLGGFLAVGGVIWRLNTKKRI